MSVGTAAGPAAKRQASPTLPSLENATEWSLGALRETLAAVSVLPIVTVVFILFICGVARNLGLPAYATVAASGWACVVVPVLLGLFPCLAWCFLSLRKGPVVVRVSGSLAGTEVVLPLGIQAIVMQMCILLWATNYHPELVDDPVVMFGFLVMLWPIAAYGMLLLYCFLPRTRGFLVLGDPVATKTPTVRAPGAIWGLGVSAVALLALALQAPHWSLAENEVYQWTSFFVAEWSAALAVGILEMLVLLTVPAQREAVRQP